jgi:hypothetical protein
MTSIIQESLIFQTQLKSEEFEATGTSIGTENFSNIRRYSQTMHEYNGGFFYSLWVNKRKVSYDVKNIMLKWSTFYEG